MTQVRRVVLCELAQPTSGVPTSVRAYVALPDRGAPLSQFKRFRVKALRPGHPLYRDERVCDRDPELLAGVNRCGQPIMGD